VKHRDLGLRHKAALCHLGALPVLTSIWLPLLVRRSDSDDDFLYQHATGAAVYQAISLASLLAMWLSSGGPYKLMGEAAAGFLLAFLGVIAFCLAGTYFLGALALAFQAWNGDPFWAPLVNRLLGYDEPSTE
jgi:hypothetical protein